MAPCPSPYGGLVTLGAAVIVAVCYLRAAVLDSNFKIRPRLSGREGPGKHDGRADLNVCVIAASLLLSIVATTTAASIKMYTAGWQQEHWSVDRCFSFQVYRCCLAVILSHPTRYIFSSMFVVLNSRVRRREASSIVSKTHSYPSTPRNPQRVW